MKPNLTAFVKEHLKAKRKEGKRVVLEMMRLAENLGVSFHSVKTMYYKRNAIKINRKIGRVTVKKIN